MTDTARGEQLKSLESILPELTPLYIGKGVVIEGTVTFMSDDPQQRLVVLGEVRGNIHTNGILQIAEGAIVLADSTIECAEIVVAGKLSGNGVTVTADVLMLKATGNVEIDMLRLPPGGLEQCRGGVLNARLDMSGEPRDAKPKLVVVDAAAQKAATAVTAASAIPFGSAVHTFGKVLEAKTAPLLDTFSGTGTSPSASSNTGSVLPAGAQFGPKKAADYVGIDADLDAAGGQAASPASARG